MGFPPVPPEIKSISHYLKVADEHDARNIVISYWCRMYAVQFAMRIIPGPKAPEVSQLLLAIMDWLEKAKTDHKDNEGIMNETCAQAIIEEHAMKLFDFAEGQDRTSNFDKNMIKAFYTSGILFDILDQFGDLSDDIEEKRKYAKWRAAYIHNCLKKGEMPTPGSTVILNDTEQDSFTDFLPKSELDKLRGIQPSQDDDNKPSSNFSPGPSSSIQPPPNTWPNQSPMQPLLPDIPSQPVMPPTPTPIFPTPNVNPIIPPSNTGTATLTAADMEKAQKFCKYAGSALNYDDVQTAIDNLQKALHLLQLGKEV